MDIIGSLVLAVDWNVQRKPSLQESPTGLPKILCENTLQENHVTRRDHSGKCLTYHQRLCGDLGACREPGITCFKVCVCSLQVETSERDVPSAQSRNRRKKLWCKVSGS
ncbi:uncharacterized protein LOC144324291 [Canis aureus]